MTKPALLLPAALALVCATGASAQPDPRPACATVSDAALPAALAGWRARTSLPSASSPETAAAAVLPLRKGVDARLRRNGEVTFPVLPAKPGGSVSYGGLYEVRIGEAGNYQVSLGSGAWVEMVGGGKAVASSAHAPGPACTSVRKTVVFPLTPGTYVLEIAGNGEPEVAVMVSRVE